MENCKYIIDNNDRKSIGGTCYFEFQKGRFGEDMWMEDSVYIHVDCFDELGLKKIFKNLLEEFDYYGITEVNQEEWQSLYELSKNHNDEVQCFFEELKSWADENFEDYDSFSILGV